MLEKIWKDLEKFGSCDETVLTTFARPLCRKGKITRRQISKSFHGPSKSGKNLCKKLYTIRSNPQNSEIFDCYTVSPMGKINVFGKKFKWTGLKNLQFQKNS